MAAMTAPPHVHSVRSSTPTAWRAARGRSARGFGQKPTEFEMCTAERAGAPRGRAAQPRWRRRPPTHSQPHGPRKTARTKGQTCAGARRDSETLSWRRPAAAARGRRGPAAAAVPATRTTTRGRTHARHTPRLRIETAQAREPVEGPVPRLRGRRRHPRDQAQRQEGGRALRQDHEPHQEALLRLGQQVYQAERATSASFPHVSELQVAATASTRRHVFMKPSS